MGNTNKSLAHGGLDVDNLSPHLASLIPDPVTLTDSSGAAIQASDALALKPGTNASNVMYVPANVVNGDVITIGADTFEVDIINTDSNVNTSGALDGTSDPVVVTLASAPVTAISVGDYIRIENEILQVLVKTSTTVYLCSRGRAGTAIATHVDNSDVFVSDSVPTNISVPLVTTLTPAAFIAAFVAVFNNALSGIIRATTRSSTEFANFTAHGLMSKNQVLVVANNPGVNTTATTEDFANSTDNVWANATMVGGLDPAVSRIETITRAFTSAEELAGMAHFAFPFSVRAFTLQVRVTATGQPVAFNGQAVAGYAETTTEVLPDNIVTVLNQGPASTAYITPFDSTMTATLTAYE